MYKGIITPIVTPFNNDKLQTINYEATKTLIDYLIDNGVNGIFPLGSNGEFHVLSHKEKINFVTEVVQYVNHRIPVFAGTGACSTSEAIELSCEMEKIGVDALSVINPYFIRLSNEELYNYYQEIASSVKLPIILYNIPQNTGNSIPVAVVKELAKIDNIVGIKDSSGDIDLIRQYQKIAKENEFQVLIGSDSKISFAYKLGVKAAIAGTSNLIPQTLVSLNSALNNKDYKKAEELQKSIEILRNTLKLGTVPSILKRSIELANISPVGLARKPVKKTTPEIDEQIRKMLKFYGL
jgi:4-hydroxy-tetrahydrodipicolinate synthase